jgi:hypothetical protein
MTKAAAQKELRERFRANGYVRRQNAARVKKEGFRGYHKGDEVRLVADSKADLNAIRRHLRALGFEPGNAFQKGNQFRQPLYGREVVARFLRLMGSARPAKRSAPARKAKAPRAKRK